MGMPAPVEKNNDEFLPIGKTLFNGAFTITGHLGGGGFGLTYLATDGLNRDIVIKECYPRNLCWRPDMSINIRSRAYEQDYERVVANFVREARALAKLRHPNITVVLQLFEENDTAYMAMEYIEGTDLRKMLKETAGPMEASKVVPIANQLLEALDYIHSQDVLHRDIAPDNIIVQPDGTPLLIDFGAARGDGGKVTRLLSEQMSIIKDGYSPQEFYIQGSLQTPASDLYALGATLHHAITGKAPVDCNLRMMAVAQEEADPLEPLAGRFSGYPKGFLEAIDKCLALFPAQRPATAKDVLAAYSQDVDAEKAKPKGMMYRGVSLDDEKPETSKPSATATSAAKTETSETGGSKKMLLLGAVAVVALVGVGVVMSGGGGEEAPVIEATAVEPTPAETAPVVAETTPVEAAPAPVETVAAEPAEPAAAPIAEGTTVLAPTAEAWQAIASLSLINRTNSNGEQTLVFLGASTNPFPDGTVLLEIGGEPAPADPDAVADAFTAYLAQANAEVPEIPVTVREAFSDETRESVIEIEARKAAAFPGFTLVQEMVRGQWALTVTAADGSVFEAGDQLIGLRSGNRPLRTITEFSDSVKTFATTGATSIDLTINRTGLSETVTLPILVN